MPSDSPTRPKFLRGSLLAYQPQQTGGQPTIIAFQFNQDQLIRTLEKRAVEKKGGGGGAKEDALRVQGPPMENLKLTVQMTAADQFAALAGRQPW